VITRHGKHQRREREPHGNGAVPPHSVEAEEHVLGALLQYPERADPQRLWSELSALVCADDFYRPDHRLVFTAIQTLAIAQQPFDVEPVADELERLNLLEAAGGHAAVVQLAAEQAGLANAAAYARVVAERSHLRKLAGLGPKIAAAIADNSSAAQIVELVRPLLEPIADRTPRIELRHIADIVAEYREPEWLEPDILERRVQGVLAGQRNTFKSLIALHWMMCAALNQNPVVILSADEVLPANSTLQE